LGSYRTVTTDWPRIHWREGTYSELIDPADSATIRARCRPRRPANDLAGSPTLGFTVGASGNAFCAISAIVGTTAGDGGVAALYVDGVPASPTIAMSCQSPSALQVACSNAAMVAGLSQGSHTASLEYKSVSGATANFSEISITATTY
jgi:hypothetical protein